MKTDIDWQLHLTVYLWFASLTQMPSSTSYIHQTLRRRDLKERLMVEKINIIDTNADNLLEGSGKNMRHLKIFQHKDIENKKVGYYVERSFKL